MILKELKKHVEINIESSKIFGHEFCQKNNYFLWKNPSTIIFHKCFINVFERIMGIHFGNIILIDHNPIRKMMNSITNVMFVEKWNGRIKVSLNYLMVVVFAYFKARHSFCMCIPIIQELDVGIQCHKLSHTRFIN